MGQEGADCAAEMDGGAEQEEGADFRRTREERPSSRPTERIGRPEGKLRPGGAA